MASKPRKTVTTSTGDVAGAQQVRVDGLSRVVRSLTKAGVEAAELKDAMSAGSQVLANALREETPVRTGTLASTVRPGRLKGRAKATLGGARPKHYGVFPNYGTKYQPPQQFAARAVERAKWPALTAINTNINHIIQRNGLK